MTKALVHFAEGFEEIEAITLVDVLRRAGIETITVSVTGNRVVTGSHNIAVSTDVAFDSADYNSSDIILLPGGMPGAKNLEQHKGLKQEILRFHTAGKYLGAICAAPLVFGQLGILKGKNATCYPGYEHLLEGALLSTDKVVRSGNIITGNGVGAALDFALAVVGLFQGNANASSLAKKMGYFYPQV